MKQRQRRTAYYMRVSTTDQNLDSQRVELKHHALNNPGPVQSFSDHFTGKTMSRPGFDEMMTAARAGELSAIVVWRLDRLGRTAAGLTKLFEELNALGVDLVSIRDNFDLTTPSGRLLACILASVAAYETEVRAERVKAGMAAAKARGKQIGGSKPGRRIRVNEEKEAAVAALHSQGMRPTAIGVAVGLSRPTVYEYLERITGLTTRERRAAAGMDPDAYRSARVADSSEARNGTMT